LTGNMQKKNQNKKGVATIELLIAFAILLINITGILLLTSGQQSLAVDAETNAEALAMAQRQIEDIKSTAKLDFNLINPSSSMEDIYVKQLEVKQIDLFTKEVVSAVNWLVEHNRNQVVSLTTRITNPQALDGGDTCSSILDEEDWTAPKLLGDVDIGQNNGATDVDIFMGKAFATANASAVNKHDFYIVDVVNPSLSPLPILGSINTGPGLEAVHVSKNYAYVANTSINGQLQIIDLTNLSNPVLVSTLQLTNVTGSGGQALGSAIFYSDGMVYLGLTKTATGPEFNIIDVANPSAPVWRGGFSIGHGINAIYVKNDLAYIASPHNQELIVLDVNDPTTPSMIGNIDLPDNSANGSSIAVVGHTLFLGRTKGASAATKELQLLDITNPANLVAIGAADVHATINAIAIRDNLVFMVTNDPNLGFQVWNLDTMTLHGSKNIQQTSTGGMDCEGGYIYVAQRSNKALQIIGPGP
jgi:Tfp pilus assembly protein PilV